MLVLLDQKLCISCEKNAARSWLFYQEIFVSHNRAEKDQLDMRKFYNYERLWQPLQLVGPVVFLAFFMFL